MQRIKGMLKRRSRGDDTLQNEISNMEITPQTPPDPVSLSTTPPQPPPLQALSNSGGDLATILNGDSNHHHQLNDNTRALMMDKIEQLTNEKYSLEDTLVDLNLKLERLGRVEEENLDLRSIADDLQKALALEKRRSLWQKKFYEKRICQLTGLPVDSPIPLGDDDEDVDGAAAGEALPPPEEMETNQNENSTAKLQKAKSIEDLLECNAFYEGTIRSLVSVQEGKSKELEEIRKAHEEKLLELTAKHEAEVRAILESSHYQIQRMMDENEAIIMDLLKGCQGLFEDLKLEYNAECRVNSELTSPKSSENIMVQFRALSPSMKGVVIAGITVISVATAGWASWGFIVWVWPRLIVFAEMLLANPESSLMYLVAFLNSVPFREFQKSWEEGKSLSECLKAFANTEFLTSALRMAPDLFAQLKNMRRVPQSRNLI